MLGDSAAASSAVGVAGAQWRARLPSSPSCEWRTALAQAERALAARDTRGVAAARATIWTAVLAASFSEATGAARRGAVEQARSWLLVREFRPPTRFSRAAEDATWPSTRSQPATAHRVKRRRPSAGTSSTHMTADCGARFPRSPKHPLQALPSSAPRRAR